jgi:hypothetical protein
VSEAKLAGDVASWNRALAAVHADDGQYQGCKVPAQTLTLSAFGQISQVCVESRTVETTRTIEFLGLNSGASLYYYPGTGLPPAYDSCVRQVSDRWWQAIPIGDRLSCSIGFRFVGSP